MFRQGQRCTSTTIIEQHRFSPLRHRLVSSILMVFGWIALGPACGDDGGSGQDTNTKTLAWTKGLTVGEPAARFHAEHSAVFEELGNRIIITWGRSSGTYQAGVWELQVGDSEKVVWNKLAPAGKEIPTKRGGHSGVWDSRAKRVLLFGGFDGSTAYDELWELTFHTNPVQGAWRKLEPAGSGPPGIRGHTAIFDGIDNNRMIVFGGWFGTGPVPLPLSDVWELDFGGISNGTWEKISPVNGPRARAEHAAILDPPNARMIMFGGLGQDSETLDTIYLNDTWELSWGSGSVTWTELVSEGGPPPARSGHAAVYDAEDERMVVFGGVNSGVSYSDVWIMDLTQAGKAVWTEWIPEAEDLPFSREQHVAVHPGGGQDLRAIIYGGTEDHTGEVWFWGLK